MPENTVHADVLLELANAPADIEKCPGCGSRLIVHHPPRWVNMERWTFECGADIALDPAFFWWKAHFKILKHCRTALEDGVAALTRRLT
jgi:hypothetical protein